MFGKQGQHLEHGREPEKSSMSSIRMNKLKGIVCEGHFNNKVVTDSILILGSGKMGSMCKKRIWRMSS